MASSFDFSEVDRLAADLGELADEGRVGSYINSAIQGTSIKVKKAAQKSVASGDRRWKALPSALDYEVKVFQGFGASVIQSEIGYDKDNPAGRVGNLREFGSIKVSPHNDLQIALEANQKDFVHGLSEALKDAEREAGL